MVILGLASDGMICHWNISSGKILNENEYHKDIRNNLYCGDYTCDGWKLIVGGSDRNIYIYDEHNRSLEKTIGNVHGEIAGHQNRIHSIKCCPKN